MCCLASVCPVYPPRQHGAQNFVSLARPTANSAEMGVCCSAPLAEPSTRVQMRPTTDGEHPHGSTAVELVSRLIQAKLRTIQFAIERMLIKWNGKRGGLPLGGDRAQLPAPASAVELDLSIPPPEVGQALMEDLNKAIVEQERAAAPQSI